MSKQYCKDTDATALIALCKGRRGMSQHSTGLWRTTRSRTAVTKTIPVFSTNENIIQCTPSAKNRPLRIKQYLRKPVKTVTKIAMFFRIFLQQHLMAFNLESYLLWEICQEVCRRWLYTWSNETSWFYASPSVRVKVAISSNYESPRTKPSP